MKKTLVLLGLALAVTIGFCGCGNEKSEEIGIEIKKISEEEIYEQLVRVEEKAKKIEDARLSMDQGFREKWDLLKRKQAIADRAFSQSDYNATSKFLQEAEAAADWIMNRAEANEQYSELESRKRYSNSNEINAPKYASTIYAEAEKYEQQGQEAYEKIEFKQATRLYVLAANEYKKATSTASAFHAAVYEMNVAKEKADKEKASQFVSTIYQPALSQVLSAIKANAQGRYDEALQLLGSAENKFENAATTASQFTAAQQKANTAKEKADEENASRWSSTIYQEALSCSQRAVSANAQGKYDEALQLLESAVETFEKAEKEACKKAEKEACKKALSNLVKSFVKIEEKNYYIAKYEVTQAQWKAVMRNNPAYFKGTMDRPVEKVSWHDAMEFCKKLNDMGLAPADYKFSLPTEAQWEYAARGGNKSKGYEYSGSNDINEVAWYNDNSGRQTHPVGEKKPNELGLYDMSGNVWEWCLDAGGSGRVLRGGSLCDNANYCQVAYRTRDYPDERSIIFGFRLTLVPVQAINANAQGKYDEAALQLLESAAETFERTGKEASKNALSRLMKDFVKIEEKDYYIGKYEVTQAQWRAVMGNNPAHFKGADCPVENVNWHDAMEFCKKLNDYGYAPRGYKFSLPTEAQWEYAARGGNKSKGYEYSGSNDINEVAWNGDNSGDKPHDVGTKKPNELGLYDMSGNVWEWCLDWYDGYGDEKEVTDPQGPQSGSHRVIRGGSWRHYANYCRVARRNYDDPDYRDNCYGFRLALVPVQ